MKFFIILAIASVISGSSAGSTEKELKDDFVSSRNEIRVTTLVNVNDCSQRFASRARTYSSEFQQIRYRMARQYEAFIVDEAWGIEMQLDGISFDYSMESQFSEAAVRTYIIADLNRVQFTYVNSMQNDIVVWQAASRRDVRALQCWRTESRKFYKNMIVTIRQRIQESINRNVERLDGKIKTFRDTVNQRVEFWEKGASKKCGKKGSSKEVKAGETRAGKTAKRRRCKVVYYTQNTPAIIRETRSIHDTGVNDVRECLTNVSRDINTEFNTVIVAYRNVRAKTNACIRKTGGLNALVF